MTKYIILNTVKDDGANDFSHFEDIVKSIRTNTTFSDIELLLLVLFQERAGTHTNPQLYRDLFKRTHNLGYFYVFGTLHEHQSALKFSKHLISQLKAASQVLIISYDAVFEFYEPCLNQNAVIKYIHEHDALISRHRTIFYPQSTVQNPRKLLIRGLGLSPNCYGIKIQNGPNFTFGTAVQTIQTSDPQLFYRMIHCVGARNLNELLRDNIIIPAYFIYDWQFAHFLALISQNHTIHQGKNIIIYHSGTNFNNVNADMRSHSFIKHILEDLAKCNIQVYSPYSESANIEYTSKSSSVINIRVLSGFNISYLSYQALYKLAPLVGVSGDNYFEIAVKIGVLPIYWSTNAACKEKTFDGLRNILSNTRLGIEARIVNSFIQFFELCKEVDIDFQLFAHINFVELVQNWPIIAEHIKANYNFYDNLENIVCENLPNEALPARLRVETPAVSHAASWSGFFTRLFNKGTREDGRLREMHRLPI